MKLMIWPLVLSGFMISSHCFLSPLVSHSGGIGGIFKGPNSETIIKGPDGSVITSETEGGEVQTRTRFEPIVVAETIEADLSADVDVNAIPSLTTETIAPFRDDGQTYLHVGGSSSVTLASLPEPVISATTSPIVASLPPVIDTEVIIQENPHIIETEIVDAPVIEPDQSSDLVGPSGSISTRGSSSVISGPASTTISEPARALVAPVIPLLAPSVVQVNQEASSNHLSSLAESAVHPGLFPTTIIGIDSIPPPLDSRDLHANWLSTSAPKILDGSSISRTVLDHRSSSGPSELFPINQNQAWSSSIIASDSSDGNNNIVQPASSYGIITNLNVDGNTTPSPELLPPEISIQVRGNPQQLLDQTSIENRQLALNPNSIPSRNIVPPEIGFTSEKAFDLGTREAVSSVPQAPGLASIGDSQGIIDDYRAPEQPLVFSRVNSVQNEVKGYPQSLGENTQLLRDTQPNAYRIYPVGELKSEDSSNVQLANIAASPVKDISEKSLLQGEADVYDDSGTEILWNRYGRRAKIGKQ